MEIKFTLNPFKNLTKNPVLYVILDKKSQKIIQKVFCVNKKEKKQFKNLLEEFDKRGKIELKKHKNWFQNFKGYSKYTKLHGDNIPIIEYEFSKTNKKT